MTALNEQSVVVVTVTYGAREGLLSTLMESLGELNLARVVVVDNGASWPVKTGLEKKRSFEVDVVELGKNTGSAVGYAAGIQRALELGAELIWLLDDDNRPHKDTLPILCSVWSQATSETPRDRLAVTAFRPEHQTAVAEGLPEHRINQRVNSFRGFHVTDLPLKLWNRTHWRRRQGGKLPALVRLEQTLYSGLLFHRDVIQSIGLPNSGFVLYADDCEFTRRIHELGGQIILVTDALLDDLEASWNVKHRFSNCFAGTLKGAGDFRAYYSMRNGVYFERTHLQKNPVMFRINYLAYMSLLYAFSLWYREPERYRLLREAIKDGLAGRLGMNRRFPL
jgi:GT2 family glycosyltransferase